MSHSVAGPGGAKAQGNGRALNMGLWVLQVLAALAFLAAGTMKLVGGPEVEATFEQIGFGQGLRYLTGGLEVLGGALLLVPRLAGVGALLLAGVMVGAVFTHLALIGGSALPALVLLGVVCVIAWGRRERTLGLLGR